MILITVLFLLPLYYLAKSKAFPAVPLVSMASILSLIGRPVFICFGLSNWAFLFYFAPAFFLFIVWVFPPKKGALGKAYLRLSFVCPECSEDVSFGRRFEGKATLCPKCDEIITVPLDEFSPTLQTDVKLKPEGTGKICFSNYGSEIFAIQQQSLFESHGIESQLIDATGGGVLPQLGGSQGFKIMIDSEDWDLALEIDVAATKNQRG